MNFADIKKKLSGAQPSADPSRAFGSEAKMMEALRRQNFTPPKPRPSAAEVVGNLRQRFAARPAANTERTEREDVSRTYAPEAMAQPEWENPFTAPAKPPRPQRDVPVYTAVSGDMPFERRAAAPAYAPGGYTAPYPPENYGGAYPPPYYEPYGAPGFDPRYTAPLMREAPYAQSAYYAPDPYAPQGYAQPAYDPRYAAAASAPEYPESAYAPQSYAPPEYAPPEYIPQGYAPPQELPPEYMPPEGFAPPPAGAVRAAPVRRKGKKLQGEDLRYLLWSGSIVSGVVLTLVAFVYACTL